MPDGDLDGDSRSDLIVGAHGEDGEAGPNTGAAYIVFLAATGGVRWRVAEVKREYFHAQRPRSSQVI